MNLSLCFVLCAFCWPFVDLDRWLAQSVEEGILAVVANAEKGRIFTLILTEYFMYLAITLCDDEALLLPFRLPTT